MNDSYFITLRRAATLVLVLFAIAAAVPAIGHALVPDAQLHAVIFGAPGVLSLAMAMPTMRAIEHANVAYDAATPSEIPLPRTQLEEAYILGWSGTHTPTTDGTALREFPVLPRRIQLIAGGSEVIHDKLARDIVRDLVMREQTPAAAMVQGPSTITAAGGAKTFAGQILLSMKPLLIEAAQANRYNLAPWRWEQLALRVVWGDRSDIVRGGTGSIGTPTTTLTAVGVAEDFSALGDARVWGPRMPLTGSRYEEYTLDASAQTERAFEISRSASIRSLTLIAEDSNGDGSNSMVTRVSLRINDQQFQFSRASWDAIRARNAQKYGVLPPTGVAVLEMAEDQSLRDIFRARDYGKVDLLVDRAAVAGTFRIVYDTISGDR